MDNLAIILDENDEIIRIESKEKPKTELVNDNQMTIRTTIKTTII